MAKNTLTFTEVKGGGTLTMDTTPIADSETIWKGDSVTLAAGEKITITSFPEGCDAVLLVSGSSVSQTLTHDSPSYTNSGGSSATYYVSVYNAFKEDGVGYEIERVAVSAGWDYNNDNYEEITIGEDTYYADPTSYATHIELNTGETIKLSTADAGGAYTLIYVANASTPYVERLTSAGWTADDDVELVICGQSQYKTETVAYQVINRATTEPDTAVASSKVYPSTTGFGVKACDKITVATGGCVLLSVDGEVLKTFNTDGESFTIGHDADPLYLAAKSNSTSSIAYITLPDVSRREYECEYDGGSGILQLRHARGAKVDVYGDAGNGYMLIHKMEGRELVRAVNMEGFDKIKFVSDGQIDECTINEF